MMRHARHWRLPGGTLAAAYAIALYFVTAPPIGRAAERAGVIDVTVHEGTQMALALSPDRSTLVIDLQGVLFRMPAAGGPARAITDNLFDAHQPCWFAGGTRIAFQSDRDGHWRIWSVRADGSDPTVLTPGPFEGREPTCSPDGTRIAFTSDRSGNFDVWELELASGNVRQVTHDPSGESRASYSPDGREIAFVSDREKAAGIYAVGSDGQERLLAKTAVEGGGMTIPVGTPSWTPDGKKVLYTLIKDGFAKLMLDDEVVSADEDVHPFRAAWLSADEFLYTADGKIKRRSLSGGQARAVEFSAVLPVRQAVYARRHRDFSSTAPQPTLGLLKPVISPDGTRVAFGALGNLWLMDIGSRPRALLPAGPFVVTDPAWSPDGSKLVYSSDREGSLDLWIYEVRSGEQRRLTSAPGAEMRPAWSPDGSRIAYVNAFGSYTMQVEVIDIATGHTLTVQPFSFGSGYPSWSADGRSIMVSRLAEYSTSQSYYAGATNQIEVLSADGTAKPRDFTVVQFHSIGNRSACDGPVWSPDGRSIAFQMDQGLWIMAVSPAGEPSGVPRKLNDDMPSYISWTADSRRLLYLAVDELKLVEVADGKVHKVPLELTWRQKVPRGRLVVHAGKLVDGIHEQARTDVDIVIEGNRIVAVEPHKAGRPADHAVDASQLTVMPGLMDMHEHLIKEYGSSFGRLLLSYGITTVRSPGNVPSDVIEEREASAAGLRPSPRVFAAGYILDGERTYWEMSTPVANLAQADRELDRARRLRYDMIKTYVHTSEPVRERLIEGAHKLGIQTSSHEIYPAAAFGSDSVEHLDGNGSSRGYSTKTSELNKVYDDVIQILSKSGMTITPTLSLFTSTEEFAGAAAKADPRWQAQPAWVRAPGGGFVMPPTPEPLLQNVRDAILKLHRAGARIVTGTDSPLTLIGLSTHNELEQEVRAGLTPFEALQTATVVPAELLDESADLGSVTTGKLADLVIVEGDPLLDIHNARNVRQVIVNGEVFGPETLPLGSVGAAPAK
jgi:Tol biopolymer transport system component/imidazolonepropionase-like amidohydrolase